MERSRHVPRPREFGRGDDPHRGIKALPGQARLGVLGEFGPPGWRRAGVRLCVSWLRKTHAPETVPRRGGRTGRVSWPRDRGDPVHGPADPSLHGTEADGLAHLQLTLPDREDLVDAPACAALGHG